ncbi:N-acetylmuramoyl-L-alanine amidase family protein [Vallitalea okinawensis]|uniref:N-acetylmuramoyl-L-alanine amidase family protein n=1 Tax=Vallitalea okinawensis TaxID=2078660 RepID=UPI000CFB2371|nr:N-acetylmuramoyl-L-alanine amidase family protein [Vallitalea okinawensis]
MKLKRIISTVLIFSFVFNLLSFVSLAEEDELKIKYDEQIYSYSKFPAIHIDGQPMKEGAMPPIITPAGRTIVPVREFFETIGGDVQWNGETKEVYILSGNNFIVLKIDDYIAYVNGMAVEMDETAKLVANMNDPSNTKTMVPLRFILEALDYGVVWDHDSYTILATKNQDNSDETTDNQDNTNEEDNTNNEDNTNDDNDPEPIEGLPTPLAKNPIAFTNAEDIPDVADGEKEIPYKKYDDTDITGFAFIEEQGGFKFIVSASSAISGIETTIWNNKLIIDIANANKEFDEETVLLEDNPYFEAVRSSQYSKDPLATRIVLDMKYDDINYSLKLTDDRTDMILTVSRNYIYDIELAQDQFGDYVDITGTELPVLDIFWLANPTRLVIDVPYSDSAFLYEESDAEGQYVKNVRTSKFNDDTTRIVLELNGNAEFSVSELDDDTVRVRLVPPTYKNINYQYTSNPTIVISKQVPGIDIDAFIINDDYLNKRAVITIPSTNLEAVYGYGTININDDDVKQVNLSSDQTGYQVEIITKAIKGYTITEDDNSIYINILDPQSVYEKIVVVDAGHGGSDPGKPAGEGNYAEMNEKEANLDISLKLETLLTYHKDIKVYMTRVEDTYPTLQERCELANEVGADLFISVHNNAFFSSYNGTETLYYDTGSGITKAFATIMQETTYSQVGTDNRGLRYRDDLYVLKHTKMPAVIVEVAYMTSPIDGPRLKEESFIDNAAVGIYNGIIESLEMLESKGLLN